MSFRVLNPSHSSRWYRQLGKGAALVGAGLLGYAGLSSVFGGKREETESPDTSSGLQLQETIDTLKPITEAQVSFSDTIQTFDHPVSSSMLDSNPSLISSIEIVDEGQGLDIEYRAQDPGPLGTFNQGGAEFQVNTFTTHVQRLPSIATINNGFIVVWYSQIQEDIYGNVYAQRYDLFGNPQGSEFRINEDLSGYQSSQDISAIDSGNSFVVVWASYSDGSGYGVYARRYNSSGNPQGSEIRVNTYTTDDQGCHLCHGVHVGAINGGFVVTWESKDQDGSGLGVYGQRYDVSGNPQGSEFRINNYTTGDQSNPNISAINGGFVVVWQGVGNEDSQGIYGRRYNEAGVPQGSQFLVNTYITGGQYTHSVSTLGDGFVVVWNNNDGQDGDIHGVYGQRYDSFGVKQGSEFQVNTYTTGVQAVSGLHAVTQLSNGDFVVVWVSDGLDGGGYGIYGRRYDASGNPLGNYFQVNTYTTSNQSNAAMSSIGNGFVVVWEDNSGHDGDSTGVFGRISAPTLTHNQLTINEGETVILAFTEFGAIDMDQDASSLIFQISDLFYGEFQDRNNSNSTVTEFTQAKINSGDIQFVHDGGEDAPSYKVSVKDTDNMETTPASANISFTNINDAPVIDGAGGTLSYTEGMVAQVIDSSLSISDVDNTSLQGATITITSNYQSGADVLGFTNQLGITGSWNAGAGILTLSGSASLANYETALESVTYENTSDNPNISNRTISWKVSDGDLESVVVTSTIMVTAINDAPILSGIGGTLTYTKNDGARAIDSAVTISDVDNTHLESATIQVTGNYQSEEDVLGFTDTTNITGSFDSETGVLTLTGHATVGEYESALESVTYKNTSEHPSTESRTISWKVSDGELESAAVTSSITVASVNDVPMVNKALVDQKAEVGTAFRYTFLSDTFMDLDGDSLNYEARQENRADIPGWLIFDDTRREFSGTPGERDIAKITIQVTARDGHGGEVSDSFVLDTQPIPEETKPLSDTVITALASSGGAILATGIGIFAKMHHDASVRKEYAFANALRLGMGIGGLSNFKSGAGSLLVKVMEGIDMRSETAIMIQQGESGLEKRANLKDVLESMGVDTTFISKELTQVIVEAIKKALNVTGKLKIDHISRLNGDIAKRKGEGYLRQIAQYTKELRQGGTLDDIELNAISINASEESTPKAQV